LLIKLKLAVLGSSTIIRGMNKAIISVYSGIDGKCCCGCAGKHRYASAYRKLASKVRGYEVTDEEISDRSVKIISNKILNNKNSEHNGDHSSLVSGQRILIAYYADLN
jgi:hypothetical protein